MLNLKTKFLFLLISFFNLNVIYTKETKYFSEGAEDFDSNLASEELNEKFFSEKLSERRRTGREDNEADLEVILNPGPMIAPDIIIRQFVDPKMSLDKMMEEIEADNKKKNSLEDEENEIQDISFDYRSQEENEIEDNIDTKVKPNTFLSTQLKTYTGAEPCRMKFNGTFGQFSLNFTQDCLILVTTPIKKSTVVLQCTSVSLANCSTNRDTLTLNLKGDLRFGRNSYVYCGSKAQVRATSIRRRISIKIKKAQDGHQHQIAKCTFHSRKRRDLPVSSLGVGAEYENAIAMVGQVGELSSTQNCGRLGRSSKIVGGRRVSPGLFPWVAQLDITRTDVTRTSQTSCTGTLISSNYILTAAHCLKNAESISVFMGGTDRHEFTGSEVIVQAEKYILHRKWSARTLTADIALVKLTDAVKFTEDVSPICLPKGKLRVESFEGKKGVAVGWGRVESKTKAPRQLYRVRLPFLDETSCKRHYRRFFVPKIMVCTDSTTEAAICYGDSGGPLMYKRQDKVYQIGVASFSLSKVCGASPDVFSHVREYVNWIESRIKDTELE